MAHRVISCSVLCFCVYLMLDIAQVKDLGWKWQDGLLSYYKALNCTLKTVGSKQDMYVYDCDHLYKRPNRIKCYVKGHEYKIGEKLREEDANLCEKDCVCVNMGNGLGDFKCTNLRNECPRYVPSKDNCYQRQPLEQCCPTEEICPEDPEASRPKCKLHGTEYMEEKYVIPKNNPDLLCICRVYDRGTFSLSCVKFQLWFDIHAAFGFYNNCAPVYLPYENKGLTYTSTIHRQSWRCERQQRERIFGFNSYYGEERTLLQYNWNQPIAAMYCPPAKSGQCPEPCLIVNAQGAPWAETWPRHQEKCRLGQHPIDITDQVSTIAYDNDTCIVCTCWLPPVFSCTLHRERDDRSMCH